MRNGTWQTRSMARRGSYAKGIAKREEILQRALEVIARSGIRGASVKEIADAVGLSQPGLLHYFDSKEELFIAILRKRDEIDAAGISELGPLTASEVLREHFLAVVRHNASVPGLVELFSRLAVDAADESNPARAYFLERGEALRELFVEALRTAQAAGTVTSAVPPESLARILQATADGLQVQWLADPSVDMPALLDDLFTTLLPANTDTR